MAGSRRPYTHHHQDSTTAIFNCLDICITTCLAESKKAVEEAEEAKKEGKQVSEVPHHQPPSHSSHAHHERDLLLRADEEQPHEVSTCRIL